jgi:cytochrome b
MKRILVWDLPTRLFHWLLAASFAVAWLTSGADQRLSIHTFFGYLMLGLIGFRLAWGFGGGHYARFTSFAYSPMAGLAYLRDMLGSHARRYIGHNPVASQAIYVLLLLGIAVCITGVFTQGGEEQQSAAAGLLSIPAGTMLKEAHEFLSWLMLALVGAHITGVAAESWLHKENLTRSMLTGTKEAPDGSVASGAFAATGVALGVATAVFAVWWFYYALHEPVARSLGLGGAANAVPHVAYTGPKLPDDPLWREECGSCHMAFHPNLLPARSWQRTMTEQARHFGADLALDAATSATLLEFMVANAAERSPTEAAYKISHSIDPASAPLRITETPYWVEKHRDIAAADWLLPKVMSKANCAACHLDAEAGTFEDAAMRMPR